MNLNNTPQPSFPSKRRTKNSFGKQARRRYNHSRANPAGTANFVRAVFASIESHQLTVRTASDERADRMTRTPQGPGTQTEAARPFRQSESEFNSVQTNDIMFQEFTEGH